VFAPTPASAYFNDPEKTVFFNEERTWYKDIYNLLWDLDLKENSYLVFQLVERKASIPIPTVSAAITRKLIEDEYETVCYSVLQVNNPDGTIRYGSYILDCYFPPVYVEELDALKRSDKQIKITIGKPGEYIPR
jgi:hypothetical protein